MLVVDASVAVKWFVLEDGHERAFAISRAAGKLAAPDRLLLEVANVLTRKVKRSELGSDQAQLAIEQLPSMFDTVVPSVTLLGDAFRLARTLDHSVYDCAYLACARHLQAAVLTADAQFAFKVRQAGYASLIRTLSDIPAS